MGLVGRWIDEKCKSHPDVMRRVLGRRFGELAVFIEADGKCGCLIGSWGIESGEVAQPDRWVKAEFRNYGMLLVPTLSTEDAVGGRVNNLTYCRGSSCRPRKRPDAFVIRLLKQRIRKSLGLAPMREIAPTVPEHAVTS